MRMDEVSTPEGERTGKKKLILVCSPSRYVLRTYEEEEEELKFME